MRAPDGFRAGLSSCKGGSLLASACVVVLYAVANWVGFHIFGFDLYAGASRVYAALVLMSLATTAICELLFNLVDANQNFLRPDRLALMFAAGLQIGPASRLHIFRWMDSTLTHQSTAHHPIRRATK